MKREIKHSVLVAALLGFALAGCQKKEEAPVPEMQGSEAPAPEAMPAEPMTEPEPMMEPSDGMPAEGTAPMEPAPMEPAPEAMPSTPPAQ